MGAAACCAVGRLNVRIWRVGFGDFAEVAGEYCATFWSWRILVGGRCHCFGAEPQELAMFGETTVGRIEN